jgi:hypothetical protein
VTSIAAITRMLARIADCQDDHGKPGGHAETVRRLDEAHKLLGEISDMRRELLGGRRW